MAGGVSHHLLLVQRQHLPVPHDHSSVDDGVRDIVAMTAIGQGHRQVSGRRQVGLADIQQDDVRLFPGLYHAQGVAADGGGPTHRGHAEHILHRQDLLVKDGQALGGDGGQLEDAHQLEHIQIDAGRAVAAQADDAAVL